MTEGGLTQSRGVGAAGKEGITRGESLNEAVQEVGWAHSSNETSVIEVERRRPAVMKLQSFSPKKKTCKNSVGMKAR